MLQNSNAIEDGGYVIERSLRFNSASSQYLTRTPSVVGNRQVWTWSGWLKRGQLGGLSTLFSSGYSTSTGGSYVTFNGDSLFFYQNNSGSVIINYISSAFFRDISAPYHIMITYNSTSSSGNRLVVYVNGSRINMTGTEPPLNHTFFINNTQLHYFGVDVIDGSPQRFLDGYLSEVNFIDGQALTPSSFGEINPATGQWVAKKYKGTYGTNGFYLDFKDGTSTTTLGQDKSGNGNNWTLTNFTRSAGVDDCWMLDVPAGNGSASAVQPSGNYAVFSPLEVSGNSASRTISHGNLRFTANTTDRELFLKNFPIPTSSSIYMEFVWGVLSGTAFNQTIGVGQLRQQYRANGSIWRDGVNLGTYATLTVGDVVGMLVNTTNNTISFYKNNTLQLTITPTDVLAGDFVYIYISVSGDSVNANFGQRSFSYAPPAGAKALCTANLPTPTIKKPSEHFNVQLSTGANIKTDSEALFTNELEWIKDRANANNHQLIDSVRGSSAVLQSNTTGAETTYTAPSGSSVGWVWRASDSVAVTNNVGSISSQVSANVVAGFSVVTYTGTGANATVGHGLGKALGLLIVKARGTPNGVARSWHVWHKALAGTNRLLLDTTDASASVPTAWNSTVPTSTVFHLGTENSVNNITGGASDYVAYCFAEITGYSKFGSYTGNGSADGPFVHTGFRPAFVLIKCIDTAGRSWDLFDKSRSGYNVDNDVLFANLTNAENTGDFLDLTSNGFKLRTTDTFVNASGSSYIFLAFAETPFQYSNAR